MKEKKVLVLRMREMLRMSDRDRGSLFIPVDLVRTRTFLSSMLIFRNSIFRRFFLASVETCLYDRAYAEDQRDEITEDGKEAVSFIGIHQSFPKRRASRIILYSLTIVTVVK